MIGSVDEILRTPQLAGKFNLTTKHIDRTSNVDCVEVGQRSSISFVADCTSPPTEKSLELKVTRKDYLLSRR